MRGDWPNNNNNDDDDIKMDAPIKPWERRNQNYSQNSPSNIGQRGFTRPRNSGMFGENGLAPPTVPRRPSRPSSSSYGPSYGGGLGYGSYSSNSMFSPHSMYGGGMYGAYNRMGYGLANNFSTNRFVRLAEESSRPAFESLESIVQAVGSIAMVLESTFFAVNSSFRAVIGLADHFSRLRTQFSQIISAFYVIRTIRYLYRKLLFLLGIRKENPVDDAWVEAKAATVMNSMKKKNRSSWPVLMFFLIVLGGPYLIWKLLHSFMNNEEVEKWATGEADHFLAEAQYDFEGENDEELCFEAGQKILVAPKELQPNMREWLLASVNGEKVGLVPLNHIRIIGKRKGKQERKQFKSDAQDVWQDLSNSEKTENEDDLKQEWNGQMGDRTDREKTPSKVQFSDQVEIHNFDQKMDNGVTSSTDVLSDEKFVEGFDDDVAHSQKDDKNNT